MKDYCSFFLETFRGKYIGECCKLHDNMCGEKGDYCFIKTIVPFYKCLSSKSVKRVYAFLITFGGSFF
ncbi:MAG: hypothetical protein KJO69_04055, partial [Gammaproteobacteria bacterium]|nr:hypothetical protein [Gammaproteobacteria bacterium]